MADRTAPATMLAVTLADSTQIAIPLGKIDPQTVILSAAKLGGFWSSDKTTWYPMSAVAKVTYS